MNTVYRGRSANMEWLNQGPLRRAREPAEHASHPQLNAVSAGPAAASSKTFVGSEYIFVDMTISKQCLASENVK